MQKQRVWIASWNRSAPQQQVNATVSPAEMSHNPAKQPHPNQKDFCKPVRAKLKHQETTSTISSDLAPVKRNTIAYLLDWKELISKKKYLKMLKFGSYLPMTIRI